MIVLLALFYTIAIYLGVRKPSYYVIYYILASTKFLGFVDPGSFIIGGIEIGYFGLNLITVFSLFFYRQWYDLPKQIKPLMLLFFLMLTYGLFKPVFDGNSSIIKALISSKELWYYALFFYLFVYRDLIHKALMVSFIKYLGVYLASMYIVGTILPQITPPSYYNGLHVRTFFPTYISLALFLFSIDLKFSNVRRLNHRIYVVILILGLCLARHLSLAVMSILGFIVYKYVYNRHLILQKYSIFALLVISFFVTIFSIVFVQDLYYDVINTINGIVTGEDGALSSRDIYNEFRWRAINENKAFGYGFIHKSSKLMNYLGSDTSNRFMESLGVVDSGFVDMLAKFGYVGTAIILGIYIKYSVTGFFRPYVNPLSLVLSMYLLQYIFINYTWSVYTFSHGIIPACIAFYFMFESIKEMNLENNLKLQNI